MYVFTCIGVMDHLGIPRLILCVAVEKYDLNMEDEMEEKEWRGIYAGVSEMYG